MSNAEHDIVIYIQSSLYPYHTIHITIRLLNNVIIINNANDEPEFSFISGQLKEEQR